MYSTILVQWAGDHSGLDLTLIDPFLRRYAR